MAPRVAVIAVGTLTLLAGCADSPTTPAPEALLPSLRDPARHLIPAGTPELEFLVLCKSGPPGTYSFNATATHPVLLDPSTGAYTQTSGTYQITVTPGSVIEGTTIPGACFTHTSNTTHNHNALAGGRTDATVTVVETGIPSGVVFDKAVITQRTGITNSTATAVTTTTTTNSASGRIGGDGGSPITLFGASIIFYNVPDVKPLTVTKTAAGSYDTKTTWDLVKTVSPASHSGIVGKVAGTSTWTVTATPNVVGSNYRVSGSITVTNPNTFPVTVDVADVLDEGTSGIVSCAGTGNATGAVPAGGTLTCAYKATPPAGSATLNTATVTVTAPSGVPGGVATAPVSFVVQKQYGDQAVMLFDPRFDYVKVISSATTVTFQESFSCASSRYGSSHSVATTFGTYGGGYHDDDDDDTGTRTETNYAKLIGLQTFEVASAKVTITCTKPQSWEDETATGEGYGWKNTKYAPSTWFMYSPWNSTYSQRGIKAGIDLPRCRQHHGDSRGHHEPHDHAQDRIPLQAGKRQREDPSHELHDLPAVRVARPVRREANGVAVVDQLHRHRPVEHRLLRHTRGRRTARRLSRTARASRQGTPLATCRGRARYYP